MTENNDSDWRPAVWPDDWGMRARPAGSIHYLGFLVGYNPIHAPHCWLLRSFFYAAEDEPGQFFNCEVNTKLPRLVMPGGV
jgi:hypothetical protein